VMIDAHTLHMHACTHILTCRHHLPPNFSVRHAHHNTLTCRPHLSSQLTCPPHLSPHLLSGGFGDDGYEAPSSSKCRSNVARHAHHTYLLLQLTCCPLSHLISGGFGDDGYEAPSSSKSRSNVARLTATQAAKKRKRQRSSLVAERALDARRAAESDSEIGCK
jgi:hypothetical protein